MECYRKPGNPGYEKFKSWTPKGGGNKEANNVEIFLTNVGSVTEEFIEPVEPVKLCLANKERYAKDMEYESHKERCAKHDLSYNLEYECHEERCANNGEYESKRKADKESGVKFSLEETIAHLVSTIGKVESVDIYCQYVFSGQ